MGMSLEEYRQLIAQGQKDCKKPQKYRNRKNVFDGIKFDSIKERDRYCQLKIMERCGLIRDLALQVSFVIASKIDVNQTKEKRYVADFAYTCIKTGDYIVEDVKSPATRKNPLYILKKHLMFLNHGITIVEI